MVLLIAGNEGSQRRSRSSARRFRGPVSSEPLRLAVYTPAVIATPASRIGYFEIVAPLGAGGMCEVYRARDTKLDRDVALKLLPDTFAADPERLRRFEREAKTLASLNHPHIAQIYGVEDRALVMELEIGRATCRERV